MRTRWLAIGLLLSVVLGVTPAAAVVIEVGATDHPEVPLDPAEAHKLLALETTSFPSLLSEVSPDDSTVLAAFVRRTEPTTLEFVNVNDGSTQHVDRRVQELAPLTDIVWRDTRTLVYVSATPELGTVIVAVDRATGTFTTTPVRLPGFPLSLAPNATRMLVARSATLSETSVDAVSQSPFRVALNQLPEVPAGSLKVDAHSEALQLAPEGIQLLVYDLNSQEVVPLVTFPPGTGLASAPGWSQDGSKLALVRMTIPELSRGESSLAQVTTQDALGNLPPERNPFLQGNVVDVFDIHRHDLRPAALKAAADGQIFRRALWSTDGQTLLVQVQHPALLAGRRYPTALYPDRSFVRFYDANLQPLGIFDRPEIEAPTAAVPQWLSPDEVLFNAPYGLNYRIFYYNRVSGEFRQVSLWDGTSYRVRSTHKSRTLVFNFGSFHHPDELYRINWDGTALAALTSLNADMAAFNRIRADQVTFTLSTGARRVGYLLQPADAPFPPRNAPIVVWQQGGPGLPMTNEWFASVETPFNLLPNFGISLLVVPLPGREGFGPQFYRALAEGDNFGQLDVDEGAQIVSQMIEQGWTTSARVGITGCSFGGYYAVQSLVRHPGLYAAANPQCTLLDLFDEWQLGFTALVAYLEGQPPTTDPLRYVEDSPVYHATQVRTPLLIFHGDHDFLPLPIVVNFQDQVEASKTPVRLLKFLGEGHGLAHVTSQATAGQSQIVWFRQQLGGGR